MVSKKAIAKTNLHMGKTTPPPIKVRPQSVVVFAITKNDAKCTPSNSVSITAAERNQNSNDNRQERWTSEIQKLRPNRKKDIDVDASHDANAQT